jgi:predicted Na+-dependent transporter
MLRVLGQQARWALPVGVFIGIVLPPLAQGLRPLLPIAVIGTITGALLRLDWSRLAAQMNRPALLAMIVAWQIAISPLLLWALSAMLGLRPDLHLVLVLQAAAPPIGSAAVFAMILGLDGSLALMGALISTLLLPFTLTPLVAVLLPGAGIEVDLGAFFVRVSLIVIAPFVVAYTLRKLLGAQRLRDNDDTVAGCNVLLLVVFAIAVMDGVTTRLLADPGYIGQLLVLACVAAAALHWAGYWLFRRADLQSGWSASLLSGNRNMGLMLAVTAGTAGEAFSLYVGIAQIPMYFAPLLLGPLVRRSLQNR